MNARCLLVDVLVRPERVRTCSLRDWDLLIRQARAAFLLARLHVQLGDLGMLAEVPVQPRRHLEGAGTVAEQLRAAVLREVKVIRGALTDGVMPLAIAAAGELKDRRIRVVSMLCREQFARQPAEWRHRLVPPKARKLAFEAGVSQGWAGLFEEGTEVICIERFGESGPYAKLAEHFGITAPAVAERMRRLL